MVEYRVIYIQNTLLNMNLIFNSYLRYYMVEYRVIYTQNILLDMNLIFEYHVINITKKNRYVS